MRTPVETIDHGTAAAWLHNELGPLRSWSAALNLANTSFGKPLVVFGATLAPCCRQHDGLSYRPRYAIEDVQRFVSEVLAALGGKGVETPVQTLEIDRDRHWKLNSFDRTGKPASRSIH